MNSYDLLYELIESTIFQKISIEESLEIYTNYEKNLIDIEKTKLIAIKRLILSFQSISESHTQFKDFFCNIRQVILMFNRKIRITDNIENKFKDCFQLTDLVIQCENNIKYLNIIKKDIKWLGNMNDFYSVFNIENSKKKFLENVKGDFRLKNMTGFLTYSSFSQKLIVRALENQINGSTILATMPTGGGKSLPGQFVSLYEEKGATIIIVPTIAIAIDQSESAKIYFKNTRKVRAYYNGISKDEKYKIFKELENGEISLLYLSPESVLNTAFYDVILNAATKNKINRLLVDEAHLISEWGEFFRTEFQFLSIFRKKLLDKTNGRLKTVLLSATVTEKTEKDLKLLFSEKNNFIQIRGDSLRNEITYYKYECKTEKIREQKILEILPFLPRPLIIYVPVIEKANMYYNLLSENGYNRIKKFTSETSSNERKNILNEWHNDDIDIIIATSAFGMGVDKKEVRAVLHTFIPENLDRFYQEVGRGGRDGFTSLSLVLTCLKEDDEYIAHFTKSKVLSVEKIIERWNAILNQYKEKASGDELWITVESVPESLKDSGKTGKLNIAWNEYVLLFLFRNKIIDILDVKTDSYNNTRIINIKLINLALANNLEDLRKYLEPIRESERGNVDIDRTYVRSMVTKTNHCWEKYFKKTYPLTENTCNGCPICRSKNKRKHYSNEEFTIKENRDLLLKSFVDKRNDNSELIIVDTENNLVNYEKIINICIEKQIDCIISDFNLIEKYPIYDFNKYNFYLYSYDDLFNYLEENIICGNIAIIFNNKDYINDKIFRFTDRLKKTGWIKTILMIVPSDIYIESQGKTIKNIVEFPIKNLGGY